MKLINSCVVLAMALLSTNALALTEKSKTEQLNDIMPAGVKIAREVIQIKQDTCTPTNTSKLSPKMSEDQLFETVKSDAAFSYLLALNSILDNESEFQKVINVAKSTVDCHDSGKWVERMYSYFKLHPGMFNDPKQEEFRKIESTIESNKGMNRS